MKLILLDAGGAGLAFAALTVFIIIAVTIEAFTMVLLKYNRTGKAFLDSFIVNIASLVVGYLLSTVASTLFYLTDSTILNWFILYALTVVVEFVGLMLLNKKSPRNKTILASVVMNLVSYLILYFFFEGPFSQ